jgi:hypothetical protein
MPSIRAFTHREPLHVVLVAEVCLFRLVHRFVLFSPCFTLFERLSICCIVPMPDFLRRVAATRFDRTTLPPMD